MKVAYNVVVMTVCIIVLSWFLPWLYFLIFPDAVSDPFVAYSPVSDSFIVSERGDGDGVHIFDIDSNGVSTGRAYTKEERDSLLPHIYFSQLVARGQLPDSINGKELGILEFKRTQWVFNSSPRDINKRHTRVYMIMESMPVRFVLEDAQEIFRLDGKVEFVDMATNSVNVVRGERFSKMFVEKGFCFPVKELNANVTTRKAYDEGYLMIDSRGTLFHMKMQAGRPYLTKVNTPDSIVVAHAFILENTDRRHLGLLTDEKNNLYFLEREGYRIVPLQVGVVDPAVDRFTVIKNMFNVVVKVSGDRLSRWIAFDSDDYHLLGTYELAHPKSRIKKIAEYLFPYELSFTSTNDCYAYPRIDYVSWKSIFLNVILAMSLVVLKRCQSSVLKVAMVFITVVFGIFSFISFLLIKD